MVLIFTGKRLICVEEMKDAKTQDKQYRHWNLFYRDILKAEVRIVDELRNETLTSEQFLSLLDKSSSVNHFKFTLLLVYHAGSYNYQENTQKSNYAARLGGGMGLSAFGDLRLAEKELSCRVKDANKIKRIFKQLQKRTANANLM